MKECFARLPKRVWKVFVRADSAFFDGALPDLLESRSCQYLIKGNLIGLAALLERQSWRKIAVKPGYESAQFEYKCSGWAGSGTFIAVRLLTAVITEEADLFG